MANHDYNWDQGADLTLSLTYKKGPEGSELPVDLTNYSFRMDIVAPDGAVMTVLNDKAIADADPSTPGNQPDTNYEVSLDDEGNISVELDRALTLPGGNLYRYLNAQTPQVTFLYDMFLRDGSDKQIKLMGGTITLNKSVTIWP